MKLTLNQVCLKKKGSWICRKIPHNMSNQRMHFYEKNRWNNAWKEEVATQVMLSRKQFGKLPLKNAQIQVILYSARHFDLDGAYNAVKPIVDGLKMNCAGVIIDDSPKYIQLEVKQIKVAKKEERVEVIIN